MFWGKMQEISRIVREIPLSDIFIPAERLRKASADEAMEQLIRSVRQHGVIEPILVRRAEPDAVSRETNPRWQLIAGERRLCAAREAGLLTVPAVTVDAEEPDCTALAITENIHREDLSFFEEAAAISALLRLTGITQEECAGRLSVSQSYVANKLRLLRLTAEERNLISGNHLSERHARALLRFDSPAERISVLETIISRRMNVAQTEEYIESMLCAKSRCEEKKAFAEKSEQRQKLIVRDIRQFLSSVDHAVDVIRRSGLTVISTRQETEDGTVISITLPNAG